jgi:RNA polymerase sigma-70 factor (ECF subfamily)
MNISGHENQGAPHMSDEELSVDGSPQSPGPMAAPEADPDQELLRAVARSDREAAAELLVQHHARAIGRLSMALLGSQAEAEDALQETLLSALESAGSFRGEGTLRAWLLGIARRKCARKLETRVRERERARSLSAISAPAGASAERTSLARRARQLLDEIKPSEREALILRFAGELSFRELSEAAGIDEAAARKRVSRGLARLRALLGEKR